MWKSLKFFNWFITVPKTSKGLIVAVNCISHPVENMMKRKCVADVPSHPSRDTCGTKADSAVSWWRPCDEAETSIVVYNFLVFELFSFYHILSWMTDTIHNHFKRLNHFYIIRFLNDWTFLICWTIFVVRPF